MDAAERTTPHRPRKRDTHREHRAERDELTGHGSDACPGARLDRLRAGYDGPSLTRPTFVTILPISASGGYGYGY